MSPSVSFGRGPLGSYALFINVDASTRGVFHEALDINSDPTPATLFILCPVRHDRCLPRPLEYRKLQR